MIKRTKGKKRWKENYQMKDIIVWEEYILLNPNEEKERKLKLRQKQ